MKYILNAPIILFTLYLFVWILSTISGKYYDYSSTYYSYIASAITLFTLSYLVTYRTVKKVPLILEKNYIAPNQIIKIFHWGSIIGIATNVINYLHLVGAEAFTPLGMALYRSKLTISLEKPLITFSFIFNPFFMSLLPFIMIFKKHLSNKEIALLLVYLISFVYISGSRSQFFIVMILWIFFYLTNKKTLNFFNVLIPILLLVFFIPTLFIILGKNLGKANSSISMFVDYLVAPSHALDVLLVNPYIKGIIFTEIETDGFKNLFLTFRPLHPLLVKLGLILHPADLLPYIETPALTNVYTIFGVYINDYGIYGSLLLISFIGVYSGYIEKLRALSKQNYYLNFLVSLNFTCLTLSCFYDYYLSSGCIWLMIIFNFFLFPKTNYEKVPSQGLNIKMENL